ncbi:hydroxymethylbilane synthase [Roseomonas elaeocarpi]|uniref:Porphobilinogen deaminase n=1 Tax=Roseomonas elaeocarpi TaxID=907779 RepID=A0ABV6JWB2_9PROT
MSAVLHAPTHLPAALPKLRAAACRRAGTAEQLRARLRRLAGSPDVLQSFATDWHAPREVGPRGTAPWEDTSWEDAASTPSTGALHAALREGRLDFAVHRLRDLSQRGRILLPEDLTLAALLPREDARDALVLAPNTPPVFRRVAIPELPIGACLGLSDRLREAQLRHLRPDLRFRALPGDAAARLRALGNGDQTATVLSVAALRRLDHPGRSVLPLDPELVVPAAGQGILAVTARAADAATRRLLRLLDSADSRAAWAAEGALLRALGDAGAVVAAHAWPLPGGLLRLAGLVLPPEGGEPRRATLSAPIGEAAALGTRLAEALRRDEAAPVTRDTVGVGQG